jgi:predicted phage tail protein
MAWARRSAEIDDAAFIAAANACDEDVALRQGGSEKRYTTNGTLDTSVQFGNALKGLLSCAVGDLTYAGGQWGYYPATWRPPTNLADGRSGYTEDDLRGAIEFNPRASHRDIFNSVKGIYVSPEVNDQQADFPFVTDPAYVAEDNGETLWKDLEFPFTNSSATAQRLGKIILRTARNQGIVKFPFRLTALQSVPPDVIRMTSGRFGWADKLFKVTDFQFASYQAEDGAPVLGVDLFARETAPDIYDWVAATDQKLIDATGTANLPGSGTVAAPTLLTLTSVTVTGSGGALQQAIDVTWHVTDAFVTSGGFINVQHAVSAVSPIWIADQSVDGADQETLITGVNSGTTYIVRVRAVNSSGATSAWVQKLITV